MITLRLMLFAALSAPAPAQDAPDEPAAEAPAESPAENPVETPPEERFRVITVNPEAALPDAPVLDSAVLSDLMQQLTSGQIPTLDPAGFQNPQALLEQLPPEIRANVQAGIAASMETDLEAVRQQAVEQAEDAALEAGEAVRELLEHPGEDPR